MLGAIIGDMAGSVFESAATKTKKDFNIFNMENRMTDDSLLTIAVAKVLMNHYPIDYSNKGINSIKKDLIKEFADTVKKHPDAGFGLMFYDWAMEVINKGSSKPYNSLGNGSAMRISPVGWIVNSYRELKCLSKAVSEITHNHPEGIKGAEAIALCVYLARHGTKKSFIKYQITKRYYPELANLNYDDLVKNYKFDATCPGSVPQAIYCFLISNSFEDAIRTAISIGGDTDTIAAMTGSIAEAYYLREGLDSFTNKFTYLFIDKKLENFISDFYRLAVVNRFKVNKKSV